MNGYKVMIIVLCIIFLALFLIDVFFVSAQYDTQESELEQALVSAMYQTTHLGALREGKVMITPEFDYLMTAKLANTQGVDIEVHKISEDPPMVEIVAKKTQPHLLGFITGKEKTEVETKTVVIGDLSQEENQEEHDEE
jgi:hypothetical protein